MTEPLFTLLLFAAAILGLFTTVWFRALSSAGAVGSGVLALLIMTAWGLEGLLPALTFLIFGSLWSRWPGGARGKKRTRLLEQVIANGLVAAIAAVGQLLFPDILWSYVMAGSFSAVAADTWSTEWGRAFGGRPLSLRTFTSVPTGESGAISRVGTLASITGAMSIALAAIVGDLVPTRALWILLVAGVFGGMVDSLAGAWIQARWNGRDGRLTEEKQLAALPIPVRGLRWVDNNVVNLLAAISGAGLACLLATSLGLD